MGRDADHDRGWLVTLSSYAGKRLFTDAGSAALFCRVLGSLRLRLGFRLRAYVVRPDRVRLTIAAGGDAPRSVQVVVHRLKSRFARDVNRKSGRLGLVWQDADQFTRLPSACDVARRADLLHHSPVHWRLARHPAEWRYSSFRAWVGAGRGPVPVDLPSELRAAAHARGGQPTRPGRLIG